MNKMLAGMLRMTGLLGGLLLGSCAVAPPPDPAVPGPMARQIVAERVSAVVVTSREDLGTWVGGRFAVTHSPKDADGGSAAPISADGYFLTADHVLAKAEGRRVFVIFGRGGRLHSARARIVWRSEESDLALLHVDEATPYFYRWTDPGQWLPAGTAVIHGGIATGFRSPVGRLNSGLRPDGPWQGARKFRMDIPLKPGDSGGPVVDARGALVGINSAVEFLVPMETAFFVESEGHRPGIARLERIMREDRARKTGR